MTCGRCKGSGGYHKSVASRYCVPCATLLASRLADPYWKPASSRGAVQVDLRLSLYWWTRALSALRVNLCPDPLGVGA